MGTKSFKLDRCRLTDQTFKHLKFINRVVYTVTRFYDVIIKKSLIAITLAVFYILLQL